MGASSEQHYSLRWNDYTVKIVTAFQSLRDEEEFVDVTVACDGQHYSAHKMVLSACSPYFRSLLRANPCQHPIVILKDVGHVEMERLLEFMYNGEVNIAQDQLAAFLKTAENLKIRGLAGSSDDLDLSSRDPHNSSALSVGAGGASGRNSPAFGNPDGVKDDDVTTDGIFHASSSSSPAHKRRKRNLGAPPAAHSDVNSHNADGLSGDSLLEAGESERVGMSGSSGGGGGGTEIDMEDDRSSVDNRRELKSEPSDAMADVYVESSDLSADQSQHSDGIDHNRPMIYPLGGQSPGAMAGPSGSALNPDGMASNEGSALPSATCEALNLSLRPAPNVALGHHVNGNGSYPAAYDNYDRPVGPTRRGAIYVTGPSQHHNHHQHQPHPMPQLRHAFSAPSSVASLRSNFKCEFHFEPKLSPPDAHHLGGGRYADSVADAEEDKKPFALEADYDDVGESGVVHFGGGGDPGEVAPSAPGSVYKTKVYPCPECLKVFRHPMSLHHHRHVHKGTYTCQSCGKVFSRRWDLHRHIHRSKMGCRRSAQFHAAAAGGEGGDASSFSASSAAGVHSDQIHPTPFDLNTTHPSN